MSAYTRVKPSLNIETGQANVKDVVPDMVIQVPPVRRVPADQTVEGEDQKDELVSLIAKVFSNKN